MSIARRCPGAIALLGTLLACSDGVVGVGRPLPTIVAATVAPGPHNVLSAVVSVEARDADSAAVFWRRSETGAPEMKTAVVELGEDGTAVIPVLGLYGGIRHELRAVVYGKGGTAESGALALTTGPLPVDLPQFTAGGPDPSPGFVVFAAGRFALALDNEGRVAWYRDFPGGVGLNLMAQPTGTYVVRPPTPDPNDVEPWIELDPLGNVVRELRCAQGLQSRFHDLRLELDGSFWIMCDETRPMDLTYFGGVADARVVGTTVQHVAASGDLLFQWSPFDHFEITDLDPADRKGATVNWTHGNAIDLTTDGDLIISFRSLGEITRIDVPTGEVVWRLGGRRSGFTFAGTQLPAFARQHSARALPEGRIVLLDNTGDPAETRVESYAVDEAARTATLVRTHGAAPGVVTPIGGSVQPLDGGRLLVSYGTAGRVEEYDASGRVVWQIEGHAGYVFRAQRIRSLYAPGVGGER